MNVRKVIIKGVLVENKRQKEEFILNRMVEDEFFYEMVFKLRIKG